MGFLGVLSAAVAGFIVGAVWYGVLGSAWTRASGVPVAEDGKPVNATNPATFALTFVFTLIVAGMMRHVFVLSGIDAVFEGIVAGFGVGAFLIAPWMGIHYTFAARPWRLLIIDGGYAAVGCATIGLVLTLL